jgi:surface antigen
MQTRILQWACTALIALSLLGAGTLAWSDPPEHAKAHGWRKKHDPRYVGYTGGGWERDYGVREGNCNRKEIGTVLGAVVGGAIGSQVGDGSGRTVAIIVGTALGALLGREIGRDLDDADRACIGHALELGEIGRPVRWSNDRSGVDYLLTPAALQTNDPKSCRRFSLKATLDGKARTSSGRACRASDGTWKMS